MNKSLTGPFSVYAVRIKFIDAILKTKEMGIDSLLVESSGLANPFGMHEVTGMLHKIVSRYLPLQRPPSVSWMPNISVNFPTWFRFSSSRYRAPICCSLIKPIFQRPRRWKKLKRPFETSMGRSRSSKLLLRVIPDDAQIQALRWHKGTMKGFLVKQTPGIDKFVLKFDTIPIDQPDHLAEGMG